MARSVRALQRAHTGLERYDALLSAAETLAITVSVTAAAFLNDAQQQADSTSLGQPQAMGARKLSALRSGLLANGVTFGTWTNWLLNVAPLAQAHPDLVPGLAGALRDDGDGPDLLVHLKSLQNERNRGAHGERPRSSYDAALRVERLRPSLERALDRADFLASMPWALIVSCSYRPRQRAWDVVARHVVGDHPDFENRSFTSREPLGDNLLYLRAPTGRLLPLSPFATTVYCEQCGQEEVAYASKAGKATGAATVKSFATGHEIEAPELGEEIRSLPETKSDGRR